MDDITITTAIAFDNSAENSVAEIAATTKNIYLSARVVDPTAGTKVRVKWYHLPDTLIASEDFEGRGGRFDFDEHDSRSFLASQIEKEDITWPLGEYRADVLLNGKTVKSAFFKIISDDEASSIAAQGIIQAIKLSDQRSDDYQIIQDKSVFSRYTNIIYVQVDVAGANPDMEIVTKVRYVKDNLEIASLESAVLGDTSIVWDLVRESLGKRWHDRLWAVGSYEVSVLVDGVLAKQRTFVVE
ncbi:hypothetical protein DRH29_00780 [candidate division Kazan bacterium]|uniref:Uncharacterized protein n=1 Tax=candidate division Kazan bacterium TaxID=2202143 RepID=A0A420ZE75_UNCK3|nr:MAG: hypothetical protein DRH29_00780 [candidate division Kazan bacterium]